MRGLTRVFLCATMAFVAAASPGGLTAQAPHACDLLSAVDLAAGTGRKDVANARQIRGTNEQSEPGGSVAAGGTECAFMGTSLTVELQQLASVDRLLAAVSRRVQAGELQPHPGLGDEAWFRHNKHLGQHGFMTRVGDMLVIIMVDTDEAGSADQAREQLLPLAIGIAAKLR